MSEKKILIFSRDPGGANSVAPLVEFFSKAEYEIALFAKDYSLQRMFQIFSLSPQEISGPSIDGWISQLAPIAAVTGTSYGDSTEQEIWSACRKLSIPSFAILDHWINYGLRFKKPDKSLNLPDYIIVPDEAGKILALLEGLPPNIVKAWGNPYYDFIKSRVSQVDIQKMRKRYNCSHPDDILIVFASEPFSTAPKSYGYKETDILNHVLHTLRMTKAPTQRAHFIIRPHPKEDREELIAIGQKHSTDDLKVFVSSEEDSLDLILASDLVCGMISQFLIEAAVLGKTCVSVQIGLQDKDPFILTQRKVVPLITTTAELNEFFNLFLKGIIIPAKLDVPLNCGEHILKELEKII